MLGEDRPVWLCLAGVFRFSWTARGMSALLMDYLRDPRLALGEGVTHMVAGVELEGQPVDATDGRLRYGDLGACVYVDHVPEGLAEELPNLYNSLLSTLDWCEAHERRSPAAACVLDDPRHVLLLRQRNDTLDVLNRAFPSEPRDAERMCKAMFRAFPDVRRIHLDAMFGPSQLALPTRLVERLDYMIIDLPTTVDAYYASLGKSTRRTLRSYRNKLRRDFPDMRTEVVSPGDGGQEIVDQLIDWKIRRFRQDSGITYWETNPTLAARTAELLARCGEARITYISDRPAAIHLCFRVGTTAYALEGGHDPVYGEYRLGFLTQYDTVCAAIEAGATTFNALEGDSEPKRLLGAHPVRINRLSVFRSQVSRLASLREARAAGRRRARAAFYAMGHKARRHRGGKALARFVKRLQLERWSKSHPS